MSLLLAKTGPLEDPAQDSFRSRTAWRSHHSQFGPNVTSLANVWFLAAALEPTTGHWDIPALRAAGTSKYNLNERPGGARTLPLRTGPAQAGSTPSDAHFRPGGLPRSRLALHYFSTKCNNVPPVHGYYTFKLPGSCGQPPTHLNGKT